MNDKEIAKLLAGALGGKEIDEKAIVEEAIKEAMEPVNVGLKIVADNDELFANVAKIIRKMIDALVAEGFTREEALGLTKSAAGSAAGKAGKK
jgi:hypothetical protein